jgi:hypothetical protein
MEVTHPSILEDPTAPLKTRQSGPNIGTTPDLGSTHVTLRDGETAATVLSFNQSPDSIPNALVEHMLATFNAEIEAGDTYPMLDPLTTDQFRKYWFGNFGAVMVLGQFESRDAAIEAIGQDWGKNTLGGFYVKPNYPGRCSHICNAGFIVCQGTRGKGVGKVLGETYVNWAPKLVRP